MGKLFGALPSHVGNLVAGKVGVPLEAAHRPDGGQPGVVGGRVHVPPGDLAARAQRPRPAGDLGGGQDQRGALEGGAGELIEAWSTTFKRQQGNSNATKDVIKSFVHSAGGCERREAGDRREEAVAEKDGGTKCVHLQREAAVRTMSTIRGRRKRES